MAKQERKGETEESNRMWASASFVGVLIIIGLPLWWKTTEVYRVSLPFDKISSFDTLPHAITTELSVLANDDATATEIIGLIEHAFKDSDVIKLKISKSIISKQLQSTLEFVADEAEAVEEVGVTFDLTQHNSFYVVQRKPLFQDTWLAGDRVLFFRDAKAATTVVETLKRVVYQTAVLEGAKSETADVARQTRFPPGAGYHIVLSVVHPNPEALDVELDAGEAVEDYIGSFVDELSVLHNFTLKSQWLHLLDFDFQAKEVKDTSEWGRHFSVRTERLHLLLTRLEERAATHVSELPTLNLALYAVRCQAAPLIIYDLNDKKVSSPVQAFMSPKWGGVVLGSPSAGDCRHERAIWRPNVRLIMGTFISQLRKLLGITDAEHITGAHLEPLRSVTPRQWEIDNLLRIRTLEQLTSAERTLQSLAQLLGEISNIVINDDVGASINSAVDSIQRASELMQKGDLVEAYKMSQSAFLAAETAFMEPSLLALLYFPDDQKYAIYIPLFLPIMFPVVLSLKNLLLWFRGKPIHKEKTD
ncbi:GPI transamidase component PIG-S isoform X1 [Trichoplusia ni]|uniref:GPI transamidase component PIG-S isoform X1 n=1 Tax=Trichoplusia ni TaxID=7111 RepID=A0A7E5WJ70_TRINI|nr:GPI transamidase component PIG-S isoform X1 [Trichoplusia ni]